MLISEGDPFFPDGLPEALTPARNAGANWSLATAAGSTAQRRRKPSATFPDPLALLRAVRHRWLLALTLGVLSGLVAGALAWRLAPPLKYTATAVIEVKWQRPILLADASNDKTEFRIFQSNQLAMMQSALVLSAALAKPAVAELPTVRAQADPQEWLENQLLVEYQAGSELMRLSLAGERPRDLLIVVNAIAETYLDEVLSKDHTDRSASSSKLKALLDDYTEKLTKRRGELRKLAESVGSDNKDTLALKQQFSVQQLATEKAELQKCQTELKRSTAELEVHRANKGDDGPQPLDPSVVAEALSRDPLLERYRTQAEDLEMRIKRTRRLIRGHFDPAVRDLQLKRAAVQQALDIRQAELRPRIEREIRIQLGDPRTDKLGDLENQVKVLTQYESMLREGVERLDREAQSFNHQTIDLQWMKDEITQWDETAKQLGKQYQALNVELKAPQRGRMIARADNARIESGKKRYAAIGMAALAAFGCTLFGVSWREYRLRRVDSADEVVDGLGLRLMGTLPALPQKGRGGTIAAGNTPPPDAARFQSLLIESVDAARAVLLRDCRVEDLRTVMITSASKGEGKSSLASHLAISVARTGRRTLLVDFDLRNPSAHRLFDVALSPGVSELLRGEVDVEEAVYAVTPDLDVAPAGLADAQALRALGQDALPDLIARLKARYDFVVIDSAPLLPVADSLHLAQHADAVVLSVYRDVSRLPAVFAGHERLAALGVRILGVVVTGVTIDHYGHADDYAAVPTH